MAEKTLVFSVKFFLPIGIQYSTRVDRTSGPTLSSILRSALETIPFARQKNEIMHKCAFMASSGSVPTVQLRLVSNLMHIIISAPSSPGRSVDFQRK